MRREPLSQFERALEGKPLAERSCQRAEIELMADVRTGRGQWQRVRLADVSSTGFRLAWMPQAEPGAELKIRIHGLERLSAVVRWRRESEVGCEFERPLSVYVFEHLARIAGH